MASVTGNGFSGRVANLIYYQMRGKSFVRIMPDKVRQTKATKASATVFGRASAIGKSIRNQLLPTIIRPRDHQMQIRLVSVISKWLQVEKNMPGGLAGQLEHVNDFNFAGKGRSAADRWKVPLRISNPSAGQVQILIPAFVPRNTIEAPALAVSVTCKLCVAVCEVKKGIAKGHSYTELLYDLNDTAVEARTISMKLATSKGSLIVTGLSLQYNTIKYGNTVPLSNKAFMPSGIIHAMYIE